jgi:hypothetical protein
MKIIKALFLVACLSAVAPARQEPVPQEPAQGPPDVTVLKSSWVREMIPGWERTPTSAESFDVMVARVASEQRVQRERNSGRRGAAARAEDESRVYEKANTENATKSAKPSRFGYRYKISIRNHSQKAIKLVDWDYVFLDPITQAEIERHQFTSEEKVGPGKEKSLSVFKLAPPTRTINAKASDKSDAPPYVERIILVRVEYADGTVWPVQPNK